MVAPEGKVELYKNIWNYHLWGFSADDIHTTLQAAGEEVSREDVRKAIREMKEKLDTIPYQELAENEFRTYLARNYLVEQELLELYFQARADLALLRSGQTRHEDGSRPMKVDIKTIMNLMAAVERQGQARASILARLAGGGGGGGGELPGPDDKTPNNLLEALTRRPQLPAAAEEEDIIDVTPSSSS